MADQETRDSFVAVHLELPNGRILAGRPIRWRVGMAIKALLVDFLVMPDEDHRQTMFTAFTDATGITEEQIESLDPDVTVGEMVDLVNRFTLLLRPGRTAAGNGATPAPIAAVPANLPASPSA